MGVAAQKVNQNLPNSGSESNLVCKSFSQKFFDDEKIPTSTGKSKSGLNY